MRPVNKLLAKLLGLLPGPVARGVATAIVLAIFARIYSPVLLASLEAELPLRVATQYLALVVYWLPALGGVIVFVIYLLLAIAAARRDNRR